ncbi:hypothetical protein [Paraburkholderia sp. MM5477-R1]|uniref:hypothetical protein n=1 Tax=Paraburkholderia sp. MM5477-R1 TaxID=2991062 RepID=UPI003D228E53
MVKDLDAWLDVIAKAIRSHVATLFGPLESRVKTLEDRPVVNGVDGHKGEDGRNGIDGKDGHNGTEGKDGSDGTDGKDGHNGADGKDGHNGTDGKDGRDGRDGKDGRDGADGRDAADLDVLPAIDFGRAYARGTVASHRGGLWRAHANTDGENGWACIVEGINTFAIERDGERGIAFTIQFASGAQQNVTFAFPVMLYRGVYVPGRIYEPGDVVTWAGSLWHCDAPTDAKPDTAPDAWTLAVKRGRDGKDFRDLGRVA